MPSYTPIDLEQIAAAIGESSTAVAAHAPQFESAALWYRLDRGPLDPRCHPPESRTPYDRRKKMDQVARSARRLRMNLTSGSAKADRVGASFRRLLKDLEIDESAVEDGPGDSEILQLLTYPDGSSEAHVLSVIRQFGCRAELDGRIDAVAELERLAREAAEEAGQLGRLIVAQNNLGGDLAANGWIVEMMRLYRAITGRDPATSVGAPARPNAGREGGPLLRFLQAAGKPLGIEFSAAAWRSQVRSILAASQEQN